MVGASAYCERLSLTSGAPRDYQFLVLFHIYISWGGADTSTGAAQAWSACSMGRLDPLGHPSPAAERVHRAGATYGTFRVSSAVTLSYRHLFVHSPTHGTRPPRRLRTPPGGTDISCSSSTRLAMRLDVTRPPVISFSSPKISPISRVNKMRSEIAGDRIHITGRRGSPSCAY